MIGRQIVDQWSRRTIHDFVATCLCIGGDGYHSLAEPTAVDAPLAYRHSAGNQRPITNVVDKEQLYVFIRMTYLTIT